MYQIEKEEWKNRVDIFLKKGKHEDRRWDIDWMTAYSVTQFDTTFLLLLLLLFLL